MSKAGASSPEAAPQLSSSAPGCPSSPLLRPRLHPLAPHHPGHPPHPPLWPGVRRGAVSRGGAGALRPALKKPCESSYNIELGVSRLLSVAAEFFC